MDDLQGTESSRPAPKSEPPPQHQHKIPGGVALEFERSYLRLLIGPEFRPIFGMVAITLTVGTVFYSLVEKWSVLDALYFCVITLATIGYGDETPITRIGKLFTIGYVFVGVGTLGLFLSTVARFSIRRSLDATDAAALQRDIDGH